jgi:hypothetical protein
MKPRHLCISPGIKKEAPAPSHERAKRHQKKANGQAKEAID